MRIRFSIAKALIAIFLFAVVLTSLRYPSPLSATLLFTSMIVMLTFALACAVAVPGQRRAFWIGFAVCGWMHVVLVYVPWFDKTIGASLLGIALMDTTYRWMVPKGSSPVDSSPTTPAPALSNTWGQLPSRPHATGESTFRRWELWSSPFRHDDRVRSFDGIYFFPQQAYKRSAFSLLTLALAFLGGRLVRRLVMKGSAS